jgi:hypothetical protein
MRVRQRALQKRRTSALSRFSVQDNLLVVERAVVWSRLWSFAARERDRRARIGLAPVEPPKLTLTLGVTYGRKRSFPLDSDEAPPFPR